MVIGVPTEVKADEYRVGMVPAGVEDLTEAGHQVLVQAGAGLGTSIADEEYAEHGAEIVADAVELWGRAELIVKIKEPQPKEYQLIRPDHVLFTYFHFAANERLTKAMLRRGATCIAYETIAGPGRELPLLTPMSEVAGRMAIHEGAKYLERPQEGRGILLAGVPGVAPAEIVIIGGGTVGHNAAKIAAGFGALVTVLDVDLDRLRYIDDVMPGNVFTLFSNRVNLRRSLREADLLIGAVLLPGARTPKLVTRQMLSLMKPGAVIVDVSVDQGGCVETIRPTTHHRPTYTVDGIVHYGVANMPGAVAGTSTYALTNVTRPYVERLATHGWKRAMRESGGLRQGLNVTAGQVTYEAIAEQFGLPYTPAEEIVRMMAT